MRGAVSADLRARKALAALSFYERDAVVLTCLMTQSGLFDGEGQPKPRCPACGDRRISVSKRHFLCGSQQTRVEIRNRPKISVKTPPKVEHRVQGCGAQGDWVAYVKMALSCSLSDALDFIDAYQDGRLTAETAHRFGRGERIAGTG